MDEVNPQEPLNNGEKTVKRGEDGRIQAGSAPLNPNGKPKGTKHFATVFMEELKREITMKKRNGEQEEMPVDKAMARAMINKAVSGDVQAFNAVADRVDGKPKQQHEHSGEDGEPLIVQFAPIFNKDKEQEDQEGK